MIAIQETKNVTLTPPQLKHDGDFARNTYIDTRAYKHLRVKFIVGETDVEIGSTAEGSAPKIEECDTTNGTYTDITGAALADQIAADEDNSVFVIDVDLTKSHKRYLRVDPPHAGSSTTGANLCIMGVLSRADRSPDTIALAGLAEWIKA